MGDLLDKIRNKMTYFIYSWTQLRNPLQITSTCLITRADIISVFCSSTFTISEKLLSEQTQVLCVVAVTNCDTLRAI